MKLNRILAVALLAGALFLSACSDDGGGDDGAVSTEQVDGTTTTADSAASDDSSSEPTDGNDDAALDVCSTVDDATVTAVLGEPGTPTDDSTGGTIYGCTWAGEGEGLNVLHVSIMVSADPAARWRNLLLLAFGQKKMPPQPRICSRCRGIQPTATS